jgi:hypothetical protein
LLASKNKKLLGLALGEKSLIAAEVTAGERPRVQQLAEFVYPDGIGPQQSRLLGAALGDFLKQKGFTAKQAVVGIPVKWLLVRSKEVPTASAAALAGMLRLQAETEFSSELKDLVFDFAQGAATGGGAIQVLLVATPRKHVEWATELCDAAKLTAVAVTPSALALGRTTGGVMGRSVLVLMASANGSELTAQDGKTSSAIRYLRAPEPMASFVSELRRTVSTLPSVTGEREIVLWNDGGVDADALGLQLGATVRGGVLATLGVEDGTIGSNGDGQKYASAVALAVSGLETSRAPVDFLHSRLAPPSERRVPHWVYGAAAAVILAIAGSIYAYQDMQNQQHALDQLQTRLDSIKGKAADAKSFVSKMNIALSWHAGSPHYLACLRDLHESIPDDQVTYVTGLTMKEITQSSGAVKDPDAGKLLCQLDGKTSDQGTALAIPDQLKVNPAFGEVTLLGTNNLPREREVSFSISFKYDPSKSEQ